MNNAFAETLHSLFSLDRVYALHTHPDVARAYPDPKDRTQQYWAAYLRLSARKEPPPYVWQPNNQVIARVEHSRWLAECPVCHGAMYVSYTDPTFWCVECGMGWNKRQPAQVIFPANHQQIEAVLNRRLNAMNRIWLPHETLADLLAENKANGVN